jgi:hypothetical protein
MPARKTLFLATALLLTGIGFRAARADPKVLQELREYRLVAPRSEGVLTATGDLERFLETEYATIEIPPDLLEPFGLEGAVTRALVGTGQKEYEKVHADHPRLAGLVHHVDALTTHIVNEIERRVPAEIGPRRGWSLVSDSHP